MLYLIATPIGNLKDLSFRAIKCLKEADLILCEDTRHSANLLRHYEIKKPLKSYHKFSEAKRAEEVLFLLKEGQTLALISDAGTPALCDPGERLVQACVQASIPIVPIPGPCALIQALVGSGLSTNPFQFIGFLPKKKGALQESVLNILSYEGTTICYESPHRLSQVLELISHLDPERQLVIARELTKKFEEYIRGSANELLQQSPYKGEIVLLIDGTSTDMWKSLSIEEHLQLIIDSFQVSQKEAITIVAKIRPVSKRDLYRKFMMSNQK